MAAADAGVAVTKTTIDARGNSLIWRRRRLYCRLVLLCSRLHHGRDVFRMVAQPGWNRQRYPAATVSSSRHRKVRLFAELHRRCAMFVRHKRDWIWCAGCVNVGEGVRESETGVTGTWCCHWPTSNGQHTVVCTNWVSKWFTKHSFGFFAWFQCYNNIWIITRTRTRTRTRTKKQKQQQQKQQLPSFLPCWILSGLTMC